MTPTVRFCVPRYRPASRGARRPLASSPSWRRIRTTTPQCMTMPGCRTCSALPGRHRAARRAAAWVCGLARPRANALPFCREAVRQDPDRDASDHLAERRGSGGDFPRVAIHAECGRHRRGSGACRDARPRGRGGHKGGRRGEESCRASGARDGIALGVAAQAEIAKDPRRRRLALADKALAAAKTDEAKARAEERRQKATSRVAEAGTQLDIATADAKSKVDTDAAAKDAVKAAETKKVATAKAANEAKLALEPASIFISRAKQKLYVRRNTHKRWPDGVRYSTRPSRFRSRSAIPTNRSARMCSPRWRATTRACAGPQSRSTTGMKPRTRSTASPSRRTCSINRADRLAALLDRRFGRAAESRDQLSHRICRGAEQPTSGRVYNAPAYQLCERRRPERHRLLFSGAIGTSKLAIRLGAATISGSITTIGGRCQIRFSCLVAKVLE